MNDTVAVIYDKKKVGEMSYVFSSCYTTLGQYDEENNIFIDRNGREYVHVSSEDCLYGNEEKAFANPVKVREIKKMFEDEDCDSINDAISRYDELARESIMLVGMTDTGVTYTRSIPIVDKYEDEDESTISFTPDPDGALGGVTFTPDNDMIDDDTFKSNDVNPKVAALIQEIEDGVYSLEELMKLRERIGLQRDDLSTLWDQLDLAVTAQSKLADIVPFEAPKKAKEENKPRRAKIPGRINLKELEDKIKKTVKGQDEHIERILTEIIRKDRDPEAKKRGLLITGSTGVGKTTIMDLLTKYSERPVYRIDTLGLTVPGYVGRDIEEELYKIYKDAGKDLSKVENAIIYFDEIDKKNSEKNSDVSGRGVLNLLLEFIEGKTYDCVQDTKHPGEHVQIRTHNMTVILGGAYNDVYKRLKAESNGVGFNNTVKKGDILRDATEEDFIKLANSPDEFIGRVTIIKLNDLSEKVLREILLDSDDSALKAQIELFKGLEVDLDYTDSYVNEIIGTAVKKNTGARGLKTAVEDSTWAAYHEAELLYDDEHPLKSVTLTGDTVRHAKIYQKTYL